MSGTTNTRPFAGNTRRRIQVDIYFCFITVSLYKQFEEADGDTTSKSIGQFRLSSPRTSNILPILITGKLARWQISQRRNQVEGEAAFVPINCSCPTSWIYDTSIAIEYTRARSLRLQTFIWYTKILIFCIHILTLIYFISNSNGCL